MTLSTHLEGDPESCRRVARRLDLLAGSLEDSSGFLSTQATLAPDYFGGLSGDAYRRSAARLRDEADGTRADLGVLSVALDAFAAELDGVHQVLRRARALAAGDLVVTGTDVQPPGPGATERQREVFRMVVSAVQEARRVEDQAHHDWQAALAGHAGTPAPSPLATGPSGLPLPHPLPDPLPDPQPPSEPPADAPTDAPQPEPPAPTPRSASTAATARPVDAVDDWEPAAEDDWQPATPEPIAWELSDVPR